MVVVLRLTIICMKVCAESKSPTQWKQGRASLRSAAPGQISVPVDEAEKYGF